MMYTAKYVFFSQVLSFVAGLILGIVILSVLK
jgi:hypothetical protein